MPPNTLRAHTKYLLVKSVGPKALCAVVAEAMGAGGWKILSSLPVPCLNCGGRDRWWRHLSCRSPTCLKLCQLSFLPFGMDTTTASSH
ncbi:hypothetical protein TNCV_4475171 [Trichonephila clavipes]|nr:hypothetical protein TNCV_4475171 [Trichonephila clavipes]